MNTTIRRFMLAFVGLFALSVVGVFAYQALWVAPAHRCEEIGNWWDPKTRTCGHVVYIPDITHRPPGSRTPVYPTLPRTPEQAAQGVSNPGPAPAPAPARP